MALMDEFREERESVKHKPLKDKISYVWEYYKLPIICVIAAIAIISSLFYSKVTEKEEVISGLILNAGLYGSTSSQEDWAALSEDFLNTMNLSLKDYEVNLNTTLSFYVGGENLEQIYNPQNQMMILTFVSAGTLDFISADTGTMISFAYQGYFKDLSELLSPEDYEAYKPYFLYIDDAFKEQLDEDKQDGALSGPVEYPDCTNPDSMQKPIPVLIDMSKSEKLQKLYHHPVTDVLCFGFTSNLPHEEKSVEFLKYMLPQTP